MFPLTAPALAVFSAALCISWDASAQVSMQSLYGHSIVAEYSEAVSSRRAGDFTVVWHDRIYISDKGRIFHKFQVNSSRAGRDRDLELVGNEAGIGEGTQAKYRWTGSGFSRSWTNGRGHLLSQTITVSGSPGALSCSMSVQRGGGRGSSFGRGQSCSIVAGNVLAGR
jgi:hypothetical protein